MEDKIENVTLPEGISEFINSFGNIIVTLTEKYFEFPYYFKLVGEDKYEVYSYNLLSSEIKDIADSLHEHNENSLTKEEIEGEGWFYKDTTEVGIDYFWDTNTKSHSIIYNYRTHRMVITMWDNERKEDYGAFIGICKNISDFRKILTMIGVKK